MTTTPVRDLLDEAAARALLRDGVPPVDPAALLARAARDGRGARRRSLVLAVVAAAVVLVVLGAGWVAGWPGPRPVPPAAPGTVRGLPDRWWTPPIWTPSVTDAPIEAASLLLATPLVAADQSDAGASVMLANGFVLVSADGRDYRSLPSTQDATVVAAALSPSGRRVAWLEAPRAFDDLPGTLVVLDLATARQKRTELPGSTGPAVLGWLPGDEVVAVTGQQGDRDAARHFGWRVDPDGGVATPCLCGTDGVLVADPAGGLRTLGTVDDAPGATPAPAGAVTVDPVTTLPTPPTAVVFSPDGRSVAAARRPARGGANDWSLEIVDARGRLDSRPLPAQLAGTVAVAWTPRGILLSRSRQDVPADYVSSWPAPPASDLWLVDPGTRAARQVSVGDRGRATVVGVARDLAASSAVARGVEPDDSHLTRAYAAYRFRVSSLYDPLTDDPDRWVIGTCAVLTLLVLAGPSFVRRRRRARDAVAGPAAAATRGLPRPTRRGLLVTAGFVVLATWVTPLLLPVAGPAVRDASPAASVTVTPVLPARVAAPAVEPALALDGTGWVRTHRLTAVFTATLAGRPGVYGLDAEFGALVRLPSTASDVASDALGPRSPVERTSQGALGGSTGRAAAVLSPGGRTAVVLDERDRGVELVWSDLRTGLVHSDLRPGTTLGDAGAMLPLDDGTVAEVTADGLVVRRWDGGPGADVRIALPGWPRPAAGATGPAGATVTAAGGGTAVVRLADGSRAWLVDLVGGKAAALTGLADVEPGYAFTPSNGVASTDGAPWGILPSVWGLRDRTLVWGLATVVPGGEPLVFDDGPRSGSVTWADAQNRSLVPANSRVVGWSQLDGGRLVLAADPPDVDGASVVGLVQVVPGEGTAQPWMQVDATVGTGGWSFAPDTLAEAFVGPATSPQPLWTRLADRRVTAVLALALAGVVALLLAADRRYRTRRGYLRR